MCFLVGEVILEQFQPVFFSLLLLNFVVFGSQRFPPAWRGRRSRTRQCCSPASRPSSFSSISSRRCTSEELGTMTREERTADREVQHNGG